MNKLIFFLFVNFYISQATFSDTIVLERLEDTSGAKLPVILQKIQDKTKDCKVNTFDCFQAFTDKLKTKWIAHVCDKNHSIYVYDTSLHTLASPPKHIFEFICGEGCIGCDYKADLEKDNSIKKLQLNWDINESSGHLDLKLLSNSKIEVEKCTELGMASNPAKEWDCKSK
jgi:hypothetical protein